ncbi:MAG: hypothetical protein IJV03_02440, partial [Alphaproteobacteria bacterium]|nr:hypothetical protein [Alphaproteobacteria bacterium]
MPETQISENGEWLRIVANWFEQRAKARKSSKKEAKFQRSEKIYLNGDESKWEEFKYYVQQAARSGSFSLNKLMQGLSQMANIGFVDNAILRKIEKGYAESNHDESKFVKWLKKHPALASYLSYYTAIALIGTMTW